jgi:hypothetical protein
MRLFLLDQECISRRGALGVQKLNSATQADVIHTLHEEPPWCFLNQHDQSQRGAERCEFVEDDVVIPHMTQ